MAFRNYEDLINYEIKRRNLKESTLYHSKITITLIFILILTYIAQVLFINPNEQLLHSLMTHTSHIFTGNYYSSLTSIFLHANLTHLITNCIALFIFGGIVEKQFRSKIIWIFLLSGVIANVLSNSISYLILNDNYYSLGASGAIAGLIIFAILLEPFAMPTIFFIKLPVFAVGWFLIALDVIGISNPSQTNHLAHFAGYSALLFLFFFLEIKNRKKIIAGFVMNIIILFILYVLSKVINFKELIGL